MGSLGFLDVFFIWVLAWGVGGLRGGMGREGRKGVYIGDRCGVMGRFLGLGFFRCVVCYRGEFVLLGYSFVSEL